MMGPCHVRVEGAANGRATPHDGRWLVAWNPHTEAGTLELTSTDDRAAAGTFEPMQVLEQWKTVSNVQRRRPWDGELNRPLTGVNVSLHPVTGG